MRELTMRLSRREFAAIAGAATLFGPVIARAGAPDIFVPGQNMPANLDPHQILDLGATAYALNVYDNLFRYEANPAKMQPWLVESDTMSPDGLTWDFRLHHGVRFHERRESNDHGELRAERAGGHGPVPRPLRRLERQPQADQENRMASDPGHLDAGPRAARRLARHDRQLPAERPGRAHRKGAERACRQEP